MKINIITAPSNKLYFNNLRIGQAFVCPGLPNEVYIKVSSVKWYNVGRGIFGESGHIEVIPIKVEEITLALCDH